MTLSQPQPNANAVIRQYALLLMSSNLIAYTFLFRPTDEASSAIAAAFALYHIGPSIRAGHRINSGERNGDGGRKLLRSPWVHLFAHLSCLITLIWEAIRGFEA